MTRAGPLGVGAADARHPACPAAGAATLVAELLRAPAGPAVLLDSRGGRAGGDGFSMLYDPRAGLGVLQRRGGVLRRHWLPGPLPDPAPDGRVAIRFGWDAVRRTWLLTVAPGGLGGLDAPAARTVRGAAPILLSPQDAAAACGAPDAGGIHPAVDWADVLPGAFVPPRAGGLGAAVPVDTPQGLVRAGRLRPGDVVCTLDAGPQPLVAVERAAVPLRGTLAPVTLRAGYLPMRADLVVAADQGVLFDGGAVEYLFGTEQVLVTAGEVARTLLATRLCGPGMMPLVTPVPARGTLLRSGAMAFAVGAAALPTLRSYEAAALLAAHRRQVPLPA
jgi:hypothetical protein